MATIKTIKQIECLIPKPSEHFFMSRITYVPDRIVRENVIFAFVVDSKTFEVKKSYRAVFSLFSCEETHYLFINDYTKEINKDSYYVPAKTKDGEKLTIDHWKFKVDDIGLFATTGNYSKDIIYFGTKFEDGRDIRSELKKKQLKQTITTETVYV